MGGARTGNYSDQSQWSRNVETRLIVAYALIAIMAAIVLWGAFMLSKKQDKDRRRDSGKGDY